MGTRFLIQSSDQKLLIKATQVAEEFVKEYLCDNVVGIVFLGAIARGYFDPSADIDIAIFKKAGTEFPLTKKFYQKDGLEVQIWLSDYEAELTDPWNMSRRWAYSQSRIYFDPRGEINRLLQDKVPLKPDEKKWLMMSGLTLSEWYVNRLTQLWVDRGNVISAHHMFDQGLIYFFDMLFGLNNELVADMKWRYYCVEQLEQLPRNFKECLKETMILHAFTEDELRRRKSVFMQMWQEMRQVVERELNMTLEEIEQLV